MKNVMGPLCGSAEKHTSVYLQGVHRASAFVCDVTALSK